MKSEKKSLPQKRSEKKEIGIHWKVATYMAVFVAVILLITWFFQVFLLNTFFQTVKKSEMEETATALAQALLCAEQETVAYRASVEHSLSVTIYKMHESPPERILYTDATGSDVIKTLSPAKLGYFYKQALEHDGSYFSNIALGGLEVNEDLLDKLPFSNQNSEKIPISQLRLLYVSLVNVSEAECYMIMLDTQLQPLASTARTLTVQYMWIVVIVLLAAAVMVYLISRRLVSPLTRMNESAKQLANGQYDTVFEGKGYRETVELADTLNYAAYELSRVDRLQKELIANISHDLRTPLTMIKGYGEVMRDLPNENTPENIQVVIDETARLSELVDDLLELSHLQSRNREPQVAVFDLTEVVREVLLRYDTLIKHKGYRVEFVAQENVLVCADRGMLLQVVYNLINNAINYTGEDRSVTVIQTVSKGTVRISVADTGEGIAPDQMPLIWERYYKVDKVHRRAMIGTGLGLSIVKEILELHRAAYGVNSTLGNGSVFWFEIPVFIPDPNL